MDKTSLHQGTPAVCPNFRVFRNFTTSEKWCAIFIFVPSACMVIPGGTRQYHCENNSLEKNVNCPRVSRKFHLAPHKEGYELNGTFICELPTWTYVTNCRTVDLKNWYVSDLMTARFIVTYLKCHSLIL